ncbi:MAG: DUF6468 domain-containing protein [Bdellovibrionales bacterium]
MQTWINLALNVILIGLVAAGLVQATRLLRHLAGLKQGRAEMERFVRDFNGVVVRAEAGIKNLKTAARDSGDDLEKLVDRATLMRDELQFIVEAADKAATRLSQSVPGTASRAEEKTAAKPAPASVTALPSKKPSGPVSAAAASRAERELMQALEKLG